MHLMWMSGVRVRFGVYVCVGESAVMCFLCIWNAGYRAFPFGVSIISVALNRALESASKAW